MVAWIRDSLEALEHKLALWVFILARLVFVVWVAAFAWMAVSWARFGGEPILFHLQSEKRLVAGEAGWLAAWVGLWLFVFTMGLAGYAVSRPPKSSVGLFLCAKYGLLATASVAAVFGVWIYLGPPSSANYLPLSTALLLVGGSSVVAYRLCPPQRARAAMHTGDGDNDQAPEARSAARKSSPTLRFADIYGNDAIKARLKEAALAITARRPSGAEARNGILLHGGPGNGKTVFAEALAGELGLPLLTLTYADVASQWVGERSARVRASFEQAKRQQPCVLFIDEVDSFLTSRDGGHSGVREDQDLVNAMLTLMVDLRRTRVILVAATNHVNRLDSAGVREGRFDFKVEITAPDLPARVGLLRKGLRDNMPRAQVDDAVINMVAQRWNGFSVKRILAVTEELPAYLKAAGRTEVGFDEFMGALRQLQGQRGHVPENVVPLSDLVFSERTRDSLDLIIGRMADPEHTERHGGTLPSGVLFVGPPGTGKTAACKALAKELGWAYLPATGADLARDPKRLEALYAKAQDLRPTVIFVDEADELLCNRQFSGSTEATNKLLTIMDGVADRVRDVVWIAATNHPDQIDPALLRGGRFAEKVAFELPAAAEVARYVAAWLGKKSVLLDGGLTAANVAEQIGSVSIADTEAILQAALNRAIARREPTIAVRAPDVERAVQLVRGQA